MPIGSYCDCLFLLIYLDNFIRVSLRRLVFALRCGECVRGVSLRFYGIVVPVGRERERERERKRERERERERDILRGAR